MKLSRMNKNLASSIYRSSVDLLQMVRCLKEEYRPKFDEREIFTKCEDSLEEAVTWADEIRVLLNGGSTNETD